MNSMEKDDILIERYFNLDLSDAELTALEKRLDTDTIFKEKVKKYEASITVVNNVYQSDSEKERVKNWRETIDVDTDKRSVKMLPNWKWIAGMAASLVILFFGWKYINTQKQNQNLIAITERSWNKDIGLGYYTTRSADTDEKSKENLVKAYRKYKSKEFSASLALLKDYDESSDLYEDAVLLRALSTHKLGDAQSALEMLAPLTKKSTKKIAKVARWYQGLIYLDINDIQSAKKNLILPNRDNKNIRLREE
ncbi:hypothetical protein [Aquimarina pacifica]|uniref:hypothetical protein n=1 Tax=Aquimarina pacifica TaxID=1296415 RepID=UPI00046F545F|nr:hypothetical protein [Aquimarina pacifica]